MSDISRVVAIRRGMRNLDAVASSPVDVFDEHAQLELGRAYDAGHVAGSGVKHQTDDEQHLCEVIREMSDAQVRSLGCYVSLELFDAIEAIRATGDAEDGDEL